MQKQFENPKPGLQAKITEANKPSVDQEIDVIIDNAPGGETRPRSEVAAEVLLDRISKGENIRDLARAHPEHFGILPLVTMAEKGHTLTEIAGLTAAEVDSRESVDLAA